MWLRASTSTQQWGVLSPRGRGCPAPCPPRSPHSLWLCPSRGSRGHPVRGCTPLPRLVSRPRTCFALCCPLELLRAQVWAQPGPRGPPGRARVPGKSRGLSSTRLELRRRVTAARALLAGLEAPSVARCSRYPRPGPHSTSGWRCNPWEGSALATGCGLGCDKPSSVSFLWHQSLSMHQP